MPYEGTRASKPISRVIGPLDPPARSTFRPIPSQQTHLIQYPFPSDEVEDDQISEQLAAGPLPSRVQNTARLAAYLADLSLDTNLAPTTIDKYTHNLSVFIEWLAGTPLSAQAGRLFLAHLQRNGYSTSSLISYYHAMKPYLEYCGIPFRLRFRKRRRLPQYHSRDHLASIINAITTRTDSWAKHARRDALIVTTLAFTGLRRAELLALRPCDIAGAAILVRHGKGDRDRAIPLPPALATQLSTYITDHTIPPSARIFALQPRRIYTIVKDAARRAGIPDISPHSLRHYFATRLIEEGAQIKMIQELLGHADLSTTAQYLDIVPKHLAATVRLFDDELQGLNQPPTMGPPGERHRRSECPAVSGPSPRPRQHRTRRDHDHTD